MILIIICTISIIVSLSSDQQLSLSSTAFVTAAAWASSSRWNQQYRRKPVSSSSSFATEKLYHQSSPAIWGRTKPLQPAHRNTCRGGNQDRRGNTLSMTDTTTVTSETDEGIFVTLIESSGLSMENYYLLSDRGRIAIQNLIRYDSEYQDQIHIYQNWPPPGTDDPQKIRLSEQVLYCFGKN